MTGSVGLEKILASEAALPPCRGTSLPDSVRLQPPFHLSWSSQVRG